MTEKIVVLGNVTKMPVGGVVWQTLQYLVGLERLGFEVWYVEAHARTPSMLMTDDRDDSTMLAGAFIDRMLRPYGLGDRWAFHALHDDGRVIGMSQSELVRLYRDAAAIINLHGGTEPREEHAAGGRLVYLETDPVQLQVELSEGVQATYEFLDAHVAFFTYGENYGKPSCGLPVSDRYEFRSTRQPVILDWWPWSEPRGDALTTIGNWRQLWRPVDVDGVTLTWSKHVEFEKVVGLARRSPMPLELALSSASPEDEQHLRAEGWRVRPALPMSSDANLYRAYIMSSQGEFTVAKEQNVALRTGWFSDRSASYLAAGRPVVTQDTGFGEVFPLGEGLFAFDDEDGALDALTSIASAPERHRRAARAIAHDFFAHDVVLEPIVDALGLTRRRTSRDAPVPPLLDLRLRSKRPSALAAETVTFLETTPIAQVGERRLATARPDVSIVVPTHDNQCFLRLALDSMLAAANAPTAEIVLVDNGSTGASARYIDEVVHHNPVIRLIRSDTNEGFARAVNRGVHAARGELLVIGNDDIVVSDGWLDALCEPLADHEIGMAGPYTNQAGATRRDHRTVATFGEFAAIAAERLGSRMALQDASTLRMFCVALSRATWDDIGPLDERFEIGMFEDDDYSLRLEQQGLRRVVNPAAFVFHFGEASLGRLATDGTYAELFAGNRARFEEKWDRPWSPPDSTIDEDYERIVAAVSEAIAALASTGKVAVISRGDDRLIATRGAEAVHFPSLDDGTYSGHYPANDDEALVLLAQAIARGVRHLVVPASSAWWLDHYVRFGSALHSCEASSRRAQLATVYSLTDLQPIPEP